MLFSCRFCLRPFSINSTFTQRLARSKFASYTNIAGREERLMNVIPKFSASARQAAHASTSASTKQYKKANKNRHKGVLKGLEEAQKLHKPEGWSRSLEEFTNQPYQSDASSRASRTQPVEEEQSQLHTEGISGTKDFTTIPRRPGVTDGPWDRRDDEAMIEALTDGPAKSAGVMFEALQLLYVECMKL